MKEDKDLLAVLVMVVPSLLLIVLVAFSLLSGGAMPPQQGGGVAQGDGDKAPQAQAFVREALAGPDAPIPPEPTVATQKRMRDPWSQFPSAGSLEASAK